MDLHFHRDDIAATRADSVINFRKFDRLAPAGLVALR